MSDASKTLEFFSFFKHFLCVRKKLKSTKSKMSLNQNNEIDEQQEDALLTKPDLPPRLVNEVQRSPPPHVSNQNVFAVLWKNRRQITSLTAGTCENTSFLFGLD